MLRQHTIGTYLKYQLLLSFLGLFLVISLTFFPPIITGDATWRKPVIGSIFNIFCILGILAVFSPKKCGKIRYNKMEKGIPDSTKIEVQDDSPVLHGHHPTCGKFSAHIFRRKDRTFCAACIGLLLGGLLALAGSVVYFYCDWPFIEHSEILVLVGSLWVSLGFFQFKFRSLIRLSSNALFVFGALLILIGIDTSIHNLSIDLLVMSLIVFWLLNRISLSQWDHEIICSSCETENCRVRTPKKREH